MTASRTVGLVVANGTLPSPEIVASLLALDPFVLAADGGADKLITAGIVPDAVLGDFDSVSDALPPTVVRIPAPDQNSTDLDKAVAHLCTEQYETIYLIAATGDRLDHTVGALYVLLKHAKSADICLVDDIGTAYPVVGSLSLEAASGQAISLLPLGNVEGVRTRGLRWDLDGETLSPGVRDGISNEATATEVTIKAGDGPLIVYVHHE